MKKFTILLIALIAGAFALEINAGPVKAPNRATRTEIYSELPSGFQQLGDSRIYYSIAERQFASSSEGGLLGGAPEGPGKQTAISILGEIDRWYYPCTFGDDSWDDGCGAGFLAAMKVNNNNAVFLNSLSGTTSNGVNMTARIEAVGEVAALITYTLTNNNNQAVTVSAGVYADIMIGVNDHAPLYRLNNDAGQTYGLKMIEDPNDENSALFCALFGEGVTDVTPADDYWFGRFDHNYSAEQLVGNTYSDLIWDRLVFADVYDENYMEEGGSYDSGMGFCWKNKRIEAGQSIELSYIISVGEIDMEEPFVPGDDRFEYEVEAFDFDGWNDLSVAHPAHVFGYYEHPYGQNGYIEYQVDGMRSWTRIPTELVSGQEFDLPFDMFFNADVTTTHTLELRFNDGLDNIVPMDGLSWTDVRSIPINGLEDRVYNGQPQTYEVTIGDGEPFSIGENGEYTDPGTYTFGFEGDFDENTIGIHNEDFNITIGQTVINVVVPEDCDYDGNEHPATATLVVGDGQIVITYKDEEGNVTTEAPVEPGTYEVFVEVTGSNKFNDIDNTSYGSFTIDKLDSKIIYEDLKDVVYDEKPHGADVTLLEGDGELVVIYENTATHVRSTEAPTEVGNYDVYVSVSETDHYYGIEEYSIGNFSITSKPTAVEEINAGNMDNGAWYTIDGRRVAAPSQTGIYIHNGKKYYVK